MQENYLSNWIQALFNSLPPEDYKNGVLVLGGDGRYFNCKASQIIIKIAAGNGVGKILVGREGIMSTPAVSAVIRKRKDNGGFIMSASHNPGGPEYDWGIKFNYSSGQPAPESITDKIYGNTLSISEIKMAEIPDADLSRIGITKACLISSSSKVFSRDQTSGLSSIQPTSGSLDRVAEKLGLTFFEVSTGWKFFGNLMDAGKLSICGKKVLVLVQITFVRGMAYGKTETSCLIRNVDLIVSSVPT